MDRINILIVCASCGGQGSVGQVALRHASLLSQYFSVILVSDSFPDYTLENVRYEQIFPTQYNFLRRYCHVPNELSFIFKATDKVVGLCETLPVAAVMCHSHAMAYWLGAARKYRLGYRLLMTTHGDIFDRPANTYSRELTWFYRWVTPKGYARADSVQALSPYMAALAVKHGAAESRVRVIPNGIDPADFSAEAVAPRAAAAFLPGGVLRLLYVGALWRVKGVDVLIRALAKLCQPCVTGNRLFNKICLTVIGDGTEKARLVALANDLGVAEQIRFLGRRPRRELAQYYAATDVLCVPSRSEALPTVVLEAMYCGIPVVGSATGGIPFLVQEGVSGCLALPEDAGELASAIVRAVESNERLASLGERGYQRARDQFTWNQVGEELTRLVREALARN